MNGIARFGVALGVIGVGLIWAVSTLLERFPFPIEKLLGALASTQ
ncbi:MAG: hypothetical protein AAB408_01985 [Patescibacteria group bacterium]